MFYRNILFLAIAIILLLFGYQLLYSTSTPAAEKEEHEEIVPPLGLPPIPWPQDNPYSKEKAELGRLLYFDKRLSSDHTISCATCHSIKCAYSDCKAIAIGISDFKGTRNSPTVVNAAYAKFLFWDGRASSLEEQSKGPIANPKEMSAVKDADEAHRQCVERIQRSKGYQKLFKNVFGSEIITIDEIAKAIATFERTILSGNSPYDRYQAGDKSALTAEQVRGLEVFKKVKCSHCHADFNFGDARFLNIGVGMDKPEPDLGRFAITREEKDWGAFKVPTLREVEHTAPYMHDGSLLTLEDVVDYYDRGGIKNKNLHPLIKPLNLSQEDKQALVSFLKSLSGEGWQHVKEPQQFPE
ncbi:MAG: cytochrome-c peroxidase [Parachlamydiaceae bacterium]